MNIIAIRDEWKRAKKAIKAAEILQESELVEDAVSRSYYAVMHAAKAALLVCEKKAESHAAVRRLFGKILVKPGLIESEWATILASEQDDRLVADYDASMDISSENSMCSIKDARRFLERMQDFIISRGLSIDNKKSNDA